MRRLILVSMRRSGSNWVQDLVANAANIYGLRELFSPDGVFGLEAYGSAGLTALRRLTGLAEAGERDPRLIAFAQAHPEDVLSTLEAEARRQGRAGLAFSLFVDQLPWHSVARLIADRRTDTVLLMRRQLPRYVSLVKALDSGVWKYRDTTAMRPRIEVAGFHAEAEIAQRWFARIAAEAPGELPRLYYEDDLCCGAAEAFATLRRAVPWLADLPSDAQLVTRMIVQDRGGAVFDRVADEPGLRRALAHAGLLETALAYPDGTS